MAKSILAQINPAAATPTTLYQVPTGRYCVIGFISIANTGTTTKNFRLSISVGGGATVTKDYLHYDVDIVKNTTFRDSDLEGLRLEQGDIIRCYSSGATFAFTLFGMEGGVV